MASAFEAHRLPLRRAQPAVFKFAGPGSRAEVCVGGGLGEALWIQPLGQLSSHRFLAHPRAFRTPLDPGLLLASHPCSHSEAHQSFFNFYQKNMKPEASRPQQGKSSSVWEG